MTVVNKTLKTPVLVSERPEVEVYPHSLVLREQDGRILNSVKDSTIFCLTKNNVFSGYSTFRWLVRSLGQLPSRSRPVDYTKDPEELEYLTLPTGVLLRLQRIRESRIYTCQVQMGNMVTETEVKDPGSRFRSNTEVKVQGLDQTLRPRFKVYIKH